MNPEVSVLVPIYNVSAYIERCAYSLFNQSFKNIEFIFVNDCTPDDSILKLLRIIEEYPIRKNQITIIHHDKNKGLAVTRNTAINASNGKYILVVDSDDYVDPEMIDILYNKAVEENADIVISDFFIENHSEFILMTDKLSDNAENHFSEMIENKYCHSYLWNKLVKRSLYIRENCRVPSGLNYYEDRHVMTRLFFYAKKIVKVNVPFYHYTQYNSNSITKNKTRMHFQNMIDFWDLLSVFLKVNNVYEIYAPIMEYPKVESKIQLMLDCNSYTLIKEFADLYINEELKYVNKLKLGEKVIMYFIRNHQFILAIFSIKILVLKNSINFQKGKFKLPKFN